MILQRRISQLIVDLHFGTFGGLISRIIYVFVGLSPIVLFVTGLTMYRLRRRSQAMILNPIDKV